MRGSKAPISPCPNQSCCMYGTVRCVYLWPVSSSLSTAGAPPCRVVWYGRLSACPTASRSRAKMAALSRDSRTGGSVRHLQTLS
jgi:hypothetical protein